MIKSSKSSQGGDRIEKSDRLLTIYSMRNNVDQSATSTMGSGWNDVVHTDVTKNEYYKTITKCTTNDKHPLSRHQIAQSLVVK